jgi:hypothetical protein
MRFLVLALLFALVAVVFASPVLGDGDGEGKGRKWLEKFCKESPDQLAKMANDPKSACVRPFSSSSTLIPSVAVKWRAFKGT